MSERSQLCIGMTLWLSANLLIGCSGSEFSSGSPQIASGKANGAGVGTKGKDAADGGGHDASGGTGSGSADSGGSGTSDAGGNGSGGGGADGKGSLGTTAKDGNNDGVDGGSDSVSNDPKTNPTLSFLTVTMTGDHDAKINSIVIKNTSAKNAQPLTIPWQLGSQQYPSLCTEKELTSLSVEATGKEHQFSPTTCAKVEIQSASSASMVMDRDCRTEYNKKETINFSCTTKQLNLVP